MNVIASKTTPKTRGSNRKKLYFMSLRYVRSNKHPLSGCQQSLLTSLRGSGKQWFLLPNVLWIPKHAFSQAVLFTAQRSLDTEACVLPSSALYCPVSLPCILRVKRANMQASCLWMPVRGPLLSFASHGSEILTLR